MKFKKDGILINASLEDTMLQEGGATLIFAQRALANTGIDCSDIKYFEIGPKHGIHTSVIDLHEPKSITCVEAPNKFRNSHKFLEQNYRWVTSIKTEKFDMHYQDFDNFKSKERYGLIFYAGVIYHNTDQMSQLRKLHDIADENAYMIFESSTTRDDNLIDKNVIEVHYKPYSTLDVGAPQTCIFHPSKTACKSMLDITGWEIIETSDEYKDLHNKYRINILCKKGSKRKNRHLTDENYKSPEL